MQALQGPGQVLNASQSLAEAIPVPRNNCEVLHSFFSTSSIMADKTFTLDECKKHVSDKDCWLVVHGKVYNVTDFLEEHPGGYDIILTSAGGRGAMQRRAKCCVNALKVQLLLLAEL
jgi:cytochrome b involved in lipid metabolism